MFKALLNVILKAVQGVINVVLLPINALIEPLFPSSITTAIGNFTTFVNTYIGSSIGWFSSLFPPIFRSLVGLALTFTIAYYTFVWSYTAIIKIWNVIQKIKFW